MDSENKGFLQKYKLQVVVVVVVAITITFITLFTDTFQSSEIDLWRLVFLLGGLIFISALLAMLTRIFKILDALKDNSTKLEEVTGSLEKISVNLAQLNHSTRVSESAKAIAFRDASIKTLEDAVLEKLRLDDFDGANELINEISKRPEYKDLAAELQTKADNYHTKSDQEKVNQVIFNIEKLFDNCQWALASAKIEGLIGAYPNNKEAKAMRQKLFEKKQERKKILLAAWDDAIQRQETDRSLDILKELDLYLTPSEGLALQEAARDVFRTKLHNLGVQFAIAVTEKRWTGALDIGQQIMNDFPNSRMSEEIREKMDVIRQNVQLQST